MVENLTRPDLELLIDSFAGALLYEEMNRSVIVANPAFYQLFGLSLLHSLDGTDGVALCAILSSRCVEASAFSTRVDALIGAARSVSGDEILLQDGRVLERDYTPVFRTGRLYGHLWHYRDVTARRQAEAKLVAARNRAEAQARQKASFIANVSHEIRSPLTSILGFTRVLAEEVTGEQREIAQLIEKSGYRLLDTLNSVLDLAQLESTPGEIARQKLDVPEEAREAVRLYERRAQEKNLALEVEAPPRLEAYLHRAYFHRILSNLVGNAVKFTDRGSVRLEVEPDASGARVVVRVRDTGIGISEEFMPHLFEEFTQDADGGAQRRDGSGLGLSITRKLVEAMGGTISVASRKGEGTVFTVNLPRFEGPEAAADAAPGV